MSRRSRTGPRRQRQGKAEGARDDYRKRPAASPKQLAMLAELARREWPKACLERNTINALIRRELASEERGTVAITDKGRAVLRTESGEKPDDP